MTRKNYLAALVEGIVEEMRRDESVFIMGQDIRAGVFGTYPVDELGERVRNLPISEAANLGSAIGAALTGMRPVIDLTISTFAYSCMDQIVNQAAKVRYMFGGQATLPLVIRATMFYGGSQAAHHADRPYPMFMNVPGLKIVVPTTPADAKGLIKAAIREDDPVLCFEDANLWGVRGEVPGVDDHVVPLGKAEVAREGSDVTIVAIAAAVRTALLAADLLEQQGVSAEVVDPRSLVPMDWDTIFGSVEKTNRLVIVDPAVRTCGAAAEIAATTNEERHASLKLPPIRVTAPDMQTPFSPPLEREIIPSRERVVAAALRAVGAGVGSEDVLAAT